MINQNKKELLAPDDLLCLIAKILDDLAIPYLVIGGMAVAVWAKPRFTWDIDIVIELLPEKLPLLAKKLLAIDKDVYVSQEAMQSALENKGEFNFIHPHTGLKVDFWILKDDSFDKNRIKRPIKKIINKQTVNFISPEDLILSKLLWYKITPSDKQLEDIKTVLKISKVDINYIKQWAIKQGTIEIFNKINNLN
ncbi:hypothetical protein COT20_01510 [bacterium (Candidatus Gribaldobacteria) CG08_land_8_20_14_0_20_39_15]|uniref:DUF6036 domain-containing protein n=1 Tax=bacterium (Candidatus Gribaldobacteria) CG08_land_8_20_14_0_20_39_15 TaxID=2014273 RepID=A0A2M6XUJ4_9BACT|nr:MAG: hypothetical protein COT20_01510 [bacterium (Candidatus Gribaldobacteria) CG08_land_8_20_14_0_20_39_15]